MRASSITATVDFDRDGVQHGFLKLPHSHDLSAWGSIMIPITVVKNGAGPTAILTGANHGDEYEGPIALFELASRLAAEEVSGRVIVVPAMNYPAFRAGKRTSPIDSGNLNRLFPGKPDGTVTERIADYFHRYLLPLSDFVLDIHSGGRTLAFVPFAATHRLPSEDRQAKAVAAMRAFNAPYGTIVPHTDDFGMYDESVIETGQVFVTTELGGGGSASAHTAAIAKRGVRNVLQHAGILDGEPERAPTVELDMSGDDCFVTSETAGLLELCVDLGEAVRSGDLLAKVHDPDRTGRAPVEYRAGMDGLLAGRHFPGLVQMGDPIAILAVPRNGPS